MYFSPFFTLFNHKCRIGLIPNQKNRSVTAMISIAIEGPKLKKLYFFQYMRPFNFIGSKLTAMRDCLPAFVWRTTHCCDTRNTSGSLEFWIVRKKSYDEMYGDGPDDVCPVSFIEAAKLIYQGKTRHHWGQ